MKDFEIKKGHRPRLSTDGVDELLEHLECRTRWQSVAAQIKSPDTESMLRERAGSWHLVRGRRARQRGQESGNGSAHVCGGRY